MPLQPNGAGYQEQRLAQAQRAAQVEQVFPVERNVLGLDVQAHLTATAEIVAEYIRRYTEGIGSHRVATHAFVSQPQLEQPRPGAIDAFVKTCQRWRLSDDQQIVLLGYASNPLLAAEFLSGRYLNLPRDVRDRVGYVVGISIGLGAVYNELLEAELAWLNRPHPKLRNQTPLAHMLQGQMVGLMRVNALVAEERALR
jgi:hypothetical protein